MVRGPAAVLGAATRLRRRFGGPGALLGGLSLAVAYFLAAPSLPAPDSPDLAVAFPAVVGLVGVAVIALAVGPAVSAPISLVPALIGSALLVAGLAVAEVGGGATPFEALLYACLGVAFAVVLDTAGLVVALPLFVAAVDMASVLGGGSTLLLEDGAGRSGDPITLELPGWGDQPAVGRLGAPDVIFLAAFAAYAHRFGLRERAGALGMTVGLAGAGVWAVALDAPAPALALVSAGFVAPNVDRLVGLLRPRGAD